MALETLADFAAARPLHPDEEACVGGAAEARRAQFRAGRHCAHQALARIGGPIGPIVVLDSRAPAWPDGFVGSISHTRDLAAAAAGPAGRYSGIGIDLEHRGRASAAVARRIALPSEWAWIEEGAAEEDRATLLFSAKEAFYKAQHPIAGVALGFRDVEVRFAGTESGDFRVELRRDAGPVGPAGSRFSGRWTRIRGHWITGVVIERALGDRRRRA